MCLTLTHPFILTWCYLIVSNTWITFPLTQCTIHEYKAGNDVSKFTHSNCITLSYYSSPKHNEWFLNDPLTSVCSNLEHGSAILTESFSLLRSVLHNLSCWSPNQKCVLNHATPFDTLHSQLAWSGFSRFELPTTNHNRHRRMLKHEYNVDGNSHYVTHSL